MVWYTCEKASGCYVYVYCVTSILPHTHTQYLKIKVEKVDVCSGSDFSEKTKIYKKKQKTEESPFYTKTPKEKSPF